MPDFIDIYHRARLSNPHPPSPFTGSLSLYLVKTRYGFELRQRKQAEGEDGDVGTWIERCEGGVGDFA